MPKKTDLPLTRQNWGRDYPIVPPLDLLDIQKKSYEAFKQHAIGEILQEISPVEDFTEKNWSLSFGHYRLGKPNYAHEDAMIKGVTFDAPLYVEATLTNKKTNEQQTQEIFLGDIPQMTDRGTFVVNGIERSVVNQLVRSPGVFFTATVDSVTGKPLYTAEIRPVHGSWLEIAITRHGTMTVKIDRRRKFPITTFLRAIGLSSNDDIRARFEGVVDKEGFIDNTLSKDDTGSEAEAMIEIFKKMHPGEPVVLEKVRESLNGLFFNNRRYDLGAVGRYKINKKLADTPGFHPSKERVLSVDDIVGSITYLIMLTRGQGVIDDIDSLANRRI